jgi:hypothetical protein
MLSDCHAQRRLMVLPPGPSGLERHAGAPADPQQLMLKRPHRIKFNLMVSAVCGPRSASRASAINHRAGAEVRTFPSACYRVIQKV